MTNGDYIRLKKRIKYAGDVHAELLKAGWDLDAATLFVENIPDADAEVVRGQWVDYMPILGAGDLLTRCSVCGLTHDAKTPFCPSCGAKMDGGNYSGD